MNRAKIFLFWGFFLSVTPCYSDGIWVCKKPIDIMLSTMGIPGLVTQGLALFGSTLMHTNAQQQIDFLRRIEPPDDGPSYKMRMEALEMAENALPSSITAMVLEVIGIISGTAGNALLFRSKDPRGHVWVLLGGTAQFIALFVDSVFRQKIDKTCEDEQGALTRCGLNSKDMELLKARQDDLKPGFGIFLASSLFSAILSISLGIVHGARLAGELE